MHFICSSYYLDGGHSGNACREDLCSGAPIPTVLAVHRMVVLVIRLTPSICSVRAKMSVQVTCAQLMVVRPRACAIDSCCRSPALSLVVSRHHRVCVVPMRYEVVWQVFSAKHYPSYFCMGQDTLSATCQLAYTRLAEAPFISLRMCTSFLYRARPFASPKECSCCREQQAPKEQAFLEALRLTAAPTIAHHQVRYRLFY